MFRAYDPERDRLLAIKAFRLDLPPERVHRLVADLQRLIDAGLTHPAIVAPVAAGISGVTAYLVQQYVAAESLDITLRQQGALPPADALRIAAQIAAALDAAAAVHLQHGTLHPRDVLLSLDETRITGLGVARALERVGVQTPVRRPYTAPERAVGAVWDRRADAFSLAALVHELLWGRRVAGFGEEAAASLTELEGGDLGSLRRVFRQALAEDPENRFSTAVEFAGALTEAFPDVSSPKAAVSLALADREREVRLEPDARIDAQMAARLTSAATIDADDVVRSVRLQPDRTPDQIPLRAEPAVTQPRLRLEPDTDDAGLGCFGTEKQLEEADSVRFAGIEPPVVPHVADVTPEPDTRAVRASATSAAPTPEPPRPIPDAFRLELPVEPQPRSSVSPLAFALLIGAALGFAVGFGVGTRSSPAPDGTSAGAGLEMAAVSGVTAGGSISAPAGVPPAGDAPGRSAPIDSQPASGSTGSRRSPPDGGTAGSLTLGNDTISAGGGAGPPQVPQPITRDLLVRSTPQGARVFVDGRDYGRTPVSVLRLEPGPHTLSVTQDGYVTNVRRVTIAADERPQALTIRLAPEPAAAPPAAPPARPDEGNAGRTGTLTVESRPPGANVFLNGKLIGTTPLMLPSVPVGEHAIHLERAGYERWASAVRIAPSGRARVAASLDR